MSWAYGNIDRFGDDNVSSVPHKGWAGKWSKNDDWVTISFLPNVLRDILQDFNFDPEAILRGWKELGWLELGNAKTRYTKQLRLNGKQTWLIVIRRKAIDQLYEENETKEVNNDEKNYPF